MTRRLAIARGWLALAALVEGAILLLVLALCALTGSLHPAGISGMLALAGLCALGLAVFTGVGGDSEIQCQGMHMKRVMAGTLSGKSGDTLRTLKQLPSSGAILGLGAFAATVNIVLAIAIQVLAR